MSQPISTSITLSGRAESGSSRPLRIAQVAPPVERVPPLGYGGTERIIDELSRELVRRGHEVVLFASGDSEAPGEHVVTVPRSLRADGFEGDSSGWYVATQQLVLRHQERFDVIHAHLEFHGVTLARAAGRPVAVTFHGRIDQPFAATALLDAPPGLVAISHAQASEHPAVPWAGIVHNGLSLEDRPFGVERDDALAFVGRITHEKGILEAIEVARRTGRRLRIAAKEPWLPWERRYYHEVFLPAIQHADVELLGEVGPAERDALLSTSYASLMPANWPEPFGLAAIESLACGTPVICRPLGGLREIVRDGVDGFFGDGVDELAAAVDRVETLDRAAIRASVLDRFSVARMADGYEAVYRRLLGGETGPDVTSGPPGRTAGGAATR